MTDEKTDIDRKDSQRFPSYFPPDPLFFEDYLTCRYEKRSIKANTSTDLICCARDESRTHTSQLTLAPETSASTISPPAQQIGLQIYEFFLNFQ